jgi:ABC-type phosphate/phosphonate transport system substrate-binding protein
MAAILRSLRTGTGMPGVRAARRGGPAFAVGLPMHDPPELRAAVDAWWAGLARALRREGLDGVPDRLTRLYHTEDVWRLPNLLLTQTCGYDLVRGWRRRFAYLATHRYAAPGCSGAWHRSFVVVRADAPARAIADLRGRVCAVNGFQSHSGCNAMRALTAPLARGGRFFARVLVSGSHAASAEAVACGAADAAAIDCISHALLARCRPGLMGALRVVAETPEVPAAPYVAPTRLSADTLARLRAGILAASQDPDLAAARAELLIAGAEVLPQAAYARIAAIEDEALRLGYRELKADWRGRAGETLARWGRALAARRADARPG